jgi:aldose 1-epimerase
LSGNGLAVTTTATNVGVDPCPYGAGAHPYLTRGIAPVDSLALRAPGRTVLSTNDRGIPVGRSPVQGTEYDFRAGRPIGATRLDHCFTDLDRDDDGMARVTLDGTVALWMDHTYAFLMLFTGDPLPDVNRRSIAVEPMTCPPNAFRTCEALVNLDPGESYVTRWGVSQIIHSG